MSQEIERKLEELEGLVKKMDVPTFKYRSVKWLARNLVVRNSKHPDYQKAMELVTELARKGVA